MEHADNEYFLSINDVSSRLGVPAHTLRYWEKQFPVAVRPTTGAGGRRYYRAQTVKKLEIIRGLLYDRGMTIAGVKKMLRDGSFPDCMDNLNPSPSAKVAAPSVDVSRDDIARALELLQGARAILG